MLQVLIVGTGSQPALLLNSLPSRTDRVTSANYLRNHALQVIHVSSMAHCALCIALLVLAGALHIDIQLIHPCAVLCAAFGALKSTVSDVS